MAPELSPKKDQKGAAAYVDVGVENFETQVVEKSLTTPVLIDFWATWCAPCRTLGPVLEKVAGASGGRFALAKIDIDKNPELADAFGIQSVPTVILMKGGRPLDGFMGALPEADVRKFLDKHLGAATDPVAEARKLEEAGRRDDAVTALRDHLRSHGDDAKARIALARLLINANKLEEAKLVQAKLSPADLESDEGKQLAQALDFAKRRSELEALAAKVTHSPDDLSLQIEHGKALVASGRAADGLEILWKTARRDINFDNGAPRKALIEVFGLLGYDDPLVVDYQQRLSVLLCS